jgi:hypothetical protein
VLSDVFQTVGKFTSTGAHFRKMWVILWVIRGNQDTVKDLPSAVLVSLLKPSVDVLRQYSVPNMDLLRATDLIIALLPNHETTSVDVSFTIPVRPSFRHCLPRAQRPPALQSPVPSGHL